MRTQRGINVQSDHAHQRQDLFAHYDFEVPIQRVCYVESDQHSFEPLLVVVTATHIRLMTFMIKDNYDDRRIQINSKNPFRIPRENYDMLALTDSHFLPIELSAGEEISCIKYFSKIGKVFYASHRDNYNQVYVTELRLEDGSIERSRARSAARRAVVDNS